MERLGKSGLKTSKSNSFYIGAPPPHKRKKQANCLGGGRALDLTFKAVEFLVSLLQCQASGLT